MHIYHILFAFFLLVVGPIWFCASHREWLNISGLFAFIFGVFLVFSTFVTPYTKDVTIIPAKGVQVFSEAIMVKANGCPIIQVDEIKFFDEPLQVRKTTYINAWGCMLKDGTKYCVETVTDEK